MKARLIALALVVGCGGKYSGAGTTPGTPAGVESAALPFRIVDARTGRDVAEADAWVKFAGVRAVCLGEEHPNPHHHWAQMQIVQELGRRAKLAGVSLALGMEMFQRPFQGVLDDYAAGRIDDAALVSRSGWDDRWGYDFALYRPVIQRALAARATLLALDPSDELRKRMSHDGYEALTAEEKAQVPELVLDDAEHRAWWGRQMGDQDGGPHGGSKDGEADKPPDPEAVAADKLRAERMYSIQVLWDESIADGAVKWIGAQTGRSIIILAGNGHCHDTGVVNRIKRRGVADVVSVHLLVDDGGNVAAALAQPENDYLFVMTAPVAKK